MLPPGRCSYVFGNPPFVGAKMQSEAQRAQVRRIARLGGAGGTLDYVAAWFLKAGDYVNGVTAPLPPAGGAGGGQRDRADQQKEDAHPNPSRKREGLAVGLDAPRIGFVATNSITQGEQVAQLWPKLFHERRLEIAFGHRTFVWPGRAAVHCVIVGLALRGEEPREKRLFSYPDPKAAAVETRHDWLTAYLFAAGEGARWETVKLAAQPINAQATLAIGTKPVDGGYLIFTTSERAALAQTEPEAVQWLRPFIGADEYINGGERWLAVLRDCPPRELSRSATFRRRLNNVRDFRLGKLRAKTQDPGSDIKVRGKTATDLAGTPSAFHITLIPQRPFLLLPRVTSERREWAAIGWVEPPAIPSDSTTALIDATLYDFAILTSAMHMAWLRQIGGRLKSDYRYSIGLVYNTFPWPEASAAQRAKVEGLAQGVLDARALPKNATSSLADLYDPDFMPVELRRAHQALDAAVDKLYAPRGFADDRARVEHLFRRYEALVMPTAAAPAANRRTTRRVARAAVKAE